MIKATATSDGVWMDKESVIGAMTCISYLGGPGGAVLNLTFASLANWLVYLTSVLIPLGHFRSGIPIYPSTRH